MYVGYWVSLGVQDDLTCFGYVQVIHPSHIRNGVAYKAQHAPSECIWLVPGTWMEG